MEIIDNTNTFTVWMNKINSNFSSINDKLTVMQEVNSSANYHNGIYRGNDLTNTYSFDELSTKIQQNDFSDLFIGDYIDTTIETTYCTETVRWLFAGFDCFLNKGYSPLTKHHIVLIPENCFTTTHYMNSVGTTNGGYYSSEMNSTIIPNYVTGFEKTFGSHLTTFVSLMTNATNTSLSSLAGAGWTGVSTGFQWVVTKCRLLSEVELYGCTIFSSSSYDVGDKNTRLPLFCLTWDKMVCKQGYGSSDRVAWWLQAVSSSASFASVSTWGDGRATEATYSLGLRPLILFS